MLRNMSRNMSGRFGVDLQRSQIEIRALAAVTAAMFALLLKILVDKGLITNEDIQTAWVEARGEDWDLEPVEPTPEDVTPG
jgi:hypothetical protein